MSPGAAWVLALVGGDQRASVVLPVAGQGDGSRIVGDAAELVGHKERVRRAEVDDSGELIAAEHQVHRAVVAMQNLRGQGRQPVDQGRDMPGLGTPFSQRLPGDLIKLALFISRRDDGEELGGLISEYRRVA
jgi:hypothetical protein